MRTAMFTRHATSGSIAHRANSNRHSISAVSIATLSSILTATILLLASTCFAQVQGNRPTVVDCAQDRAGGNTPGVILWPESVSANDTIVLGFLTSNTNTFTLADDGAAGAGAWTTTSVTTTPAPQNGTDVWMAWKRFSGSGRPTITLTQTSGTGYFYMQGCRYSGLNGTDGSVATATTSNPGGTLATLSTSNTTTTNNDVLVSAMGAGPFGTNDFTISNTESPVHEGTASPPISAFFSTLYAGAAGSITATNRIFGDSGANSTFAMQTLAFKPDAIKIADTILPDAGSGVSYSAQLHCIGGTAGQTYSLFGGSLPAGITLNTATGLISGSSTATGAYSPQFKCTDGTVTSAAQILSLQVGGTLGIPNVRQINNSWSGDNGGGFFDMNVNCGSTLIVVARGDDTHGGQGFQQAVNGVNNKISDTFGSTWRIMTGPVTGNGAFPIVVYVATVTQSGVDMVTVGNNQVASSARPISLALEVTGGNVLDNGAQANAYLNTATGSLAPSFTSVVNNTLLLSLADTLGNLTSWSVGAPFSVISDGGDVEGKTQYSTALISSPATTTVTSSFTGGSVQQQQYDALIVPIRPALAISGCPANFGTGEKIRRQIF